MEFLCLGYLDEAEWDNKSKEEQAEIMRICTEYDSELKKKGHFLGGQALVGAAHSKTVRKVAGKIVATDGPYTETKELIGGILHLQAADLKEAEKLVAQHPGVGVGPFEIRPIQWEAEGPNLEIQRIVGASPEAVFEHFTCADKLERWWGPRSGKTDWTTPSVEMTPETGGHFRTCIRSPEGQDYWARGNVIEVEKPGRLVFTHQWEENQGSHPEVKRIRITLSPFGRQTRVRMRIDGYTSDESRDSEVEGWHQCLDRLVNHVQKTDDEAILRSLVAEWSRHVAAKDSDSMMKHYHPDVILYDAIPPYKTVGREAVKQAWDQCFPCLPEVCGSEHRDLEFRVSGDLAVVNGLHRFRPEPEEHPCGGSYLRLTVVFQRTQGAWKVVHEHISQPFNPMNEKVWSIQDPEVLDMPDYAACGSKMEVTP